MRPCVRMLVRLWTRNKICAICPHYTFRYVGIVLCTSNRNGLAICQRNSLLLFLQFIYISLRSFFSFIVVTFISRFAVVFVFCCTCTLLCFMTVSIKDYSYSASFLALPALLVDLLLMTIYSFMYLSMLNIKSKSLSSSSLFIKINIHEILQFLLLINKILKLEKKANALYSIVASFTQDFFFWITVKKTSMQKPKQKKKMQNQCCPYFRNGLKCTKLGIKKGFVQL